VLAPLQHLAYVVHHMPAFCGTQVICITWHHGPQSHITPDMPVRKSLVSIKRPVGVKSQGFMISLAPTKPSPVPDCHDRRCNKLQTSAPPAPLTLRQQELGRHLQRGFQIRNPDGSTRDRCGTLREHLHARISPINAFLRSWC